MPTLGVARMQIKSCNSVFSMWITVAVMEKIAATLPPFTIHPKQMCEAFNKLALADPRFREVGGIDMLLGAGVWSKIIEPELIRNREELVAQRSKLGWLVFGEAFLNDLGIYHVAVTGETLVEQTSETEIRDS